MQKYTTFNPDFKSLKHLRACNRKLWHAYLFIYSGKARRLIQKRRRWWADKLGD